MLLNNIVLLFAKNTFAMDRTEKDYSAFEELMDEGKVYRKISDFEGICSLISADPFMLDKKIFEELGFRGQDLVNLYRAQENIR